VRRNEPGKCAKGAGETRRLVASVAQRSDGGGPEAARSANEGALRTVVLLRSKHRGSAQIRKSSITAKPIRQKSSRQLEMKNWHEGLAAAYRDSTKHRRGRAGSMSDRDPHDYHFNRGYGALALIAVLHGRHNIRSNRKKKNRCSTSLRASGWGFLPRCFSQKQAAGEKSSGRCGSKFPMSSKTRGCGSGTGP